MYARCQRVAALLRDAGLRRGDGIALVLPNRPEFFEITWGCQLSGLYYSAVNTHFTPDEVAYVIADSEAKAVFVDGSMTELAAKILTANPGVHVHVVVGDPLPGWRPYEEALAVAGDPPPASDGSEMLYSSGTTGYPKAVRRRLPCRQTWPRSRIDASLQLTGHIACEQAALPEPRGGITRERVGHHGRAGRKPWVITLRQHPGNRARQDIAHAGAGHARVATLTQPGRLTLPPHQRAGAFEGNCPAKIAQQRRQWFARSYRCSIDRRPLAWWASAIGQFVSS